MQLLWSPFWIWCKKMFIHTSHISNVYFMFFGGMVCLPRWWRNSFSHSLGDAEIHSGPFFGWFAQQDACHTCTSRVYGWILSPPLGFRLQPECKEWMPGFEKMFCFKMIWCCFEIKPNKLGIQRCFFLPNTLSQKQSCDPSLQFFHPMSSSRHSSKSSSSMGTRSQRKRLMSSLHWRMHPVFWMTFQSDSWTDSPKSCSWWVFFVSWRNLSLLETSWKTPPWMPLWSHFSWCGAPTLTTTTLGTTSWTLWETKLCWVIVSFCTFNILVPVSLVGLGRLKS